MKLVTPTGSITETPSEITCRTFARIGFLGNPSDGYFGKTISCTVSNFYAEVTIIPSEKFMIVPHPLFDHVEFFSLSDLRQGCQQSGYEGGVRVLLATCKIFYDYCTDNGIALPDINFTVTYNTNIPRQVGLSGSSAIVRSLMACLMKAYNLDYHDVPSEILPTLILSVETKELGITAGLQDRVVQVYDNLVYMDFEKEHMEKTGTGIYEVLDVDLPPLFLAYEQNPSDISFLYININIFNYIIRYNSFKCKTKI